MVSFPGRLRCTMSDCTARVRRNPHWRFSKSVKILGSAYCCNIAVMQKLRQETIVIALRILCSKAYPTPGTRDSPDFMDWTRRVGVLDKWRRCPYRTGARSRAMPNDSQPREGILSSTTFPGLVSSILRQKETGVLTLT